MERKDGIINFDNKEQLAGQLPAAIEAAEAAAEYERLEAHIGKMNDTYKEIYYGADEPRLALKAQRRYRLAGLNHLLNDLYWIRKQFKELAAPELAAAAIEHSLEKLEIEGLDLSRLHHK